MKITCDQATKICDKNQYGEAKFIEKVKLSVHLVLCKKCGMYSKQNVVMTTCYKKHKHNIDKHDCCLNEEEKKCMHEEVTSKL